MCDASCEFLLVPRVLSLWANLNNDPQSTSIHVREQTGICPPLIPEAKNGSKTLVHSNSSVSTSCESRLLLPSAITPLPSRAQPNQLWSDTLAFRIVQGHGFTFPTGWYPFTSPNEPTAHWSYLYTLYLAGVYALFGHHPLLARLIQVLLSGLNAWLAYRIGRRLFGVKAGLTAAVLTAGYAYFIFFNAALMTQTFYILAVLTTLDLAIGLMDRQTRRGLVASWSRYRPGCSDSPDAAPLCPCPLRVDFLGRGAATVLARATRFIGRDRIARSTLHGL